MAADHQARLLNKDHEIEQIQVKLKDGDKERERLEKEKL